MPPIPQCLVDMIDALRQHLPGAVTRIQDPIQVGDSAQRQRPHRRPQDAAAREHSGHLLGLLVRGEGNAVARGRFVGDGQCGTTGSVHRDADPTGRVTGKCSAVSTSGGPKRRTTAAW